MGFTARQAVLAGLIVNAIRPVRSRAMVIPGFFAGWLTNELAPHILAAQAVDTAVNVRRRNVTPAGIALAGVSAVGLGWLIQRSLAVAPAIDKQLRDEVGVPLDEDPRTPLNLYARPFKFKDRGVRRISKVAYTEGGRRAKLDVYLPAAGTISRAPVLVQIHGGGWTIGKKEQQGLLLMNRMASRGWICVASNYRLAPRYRWPTQIIDVKRAISWVRDNIAEYGGDPDYIAITGGSAGGHLSSLAALTPHEKQWQPGFEDSDTSVAAAVPFYGVYDFTGTDPYARMMRDAFLAPIVFEKGAAPEDFHHASPVHRIGDDVPEFLVLHGTNDTLARVEQAREFVEELDARHPGHVTYIELPYTQHAFEVFGSIRSRAAIRAVQRWLEWHRAAWTADRNESELAR